MKRNLKKLWRATCDTKTPLSSNSQRALVVVALEMEGLQVYILGFRILRMLYVLSRRQFRCTPFGGISAFIKLVKQALDKFISGTFTCKIELKAQFSFVAFSPCQRSNISFSWFC